MALLKRLEKQLTNAIQEFKPLQKTQAKYQEQIIKTPTFIIPTMHEKAYSKAKQAVNAAQSAVNAAKQAAKAASAAMVLSSPASTAAMAISPVLPPPSTAAMAISPVLPPLSTAAMATVPVMDVKQNTLTKYGPVQKATAASKHKKTPYNRPLTHAHHPSVSNTVQSLSALKARIDHDYKTNIQGVHVLPFNFISDNKFIAGHEIEECAQFSPDLIPIADSYHDFKSVAGFKETLNRVNGIDQNALATTLFGRLSHNKITTTTKIENQINELYDRTEPSIIDYTKLYQPPLNIAELRQNKALHIVYPNDQFNVDIADAAKKEVMRQLILQYFFNDAWNTSRVILSLDSNNGKVVKILKNNDNVQLTVLPQHIVDPGSTSHDQIGLLPTIYHFTCNNMVGTNPYFISKRNTFSRENIHIFCGDDDKNPYGIYSYHRFLYNIGLHAPQETRVSMTKVTPTIIQGASIDYITNLFKALLNNSQPQFIVPPELSRILPIGQDIATNGIFPYFSTNPLAIVDPKRAGDGDMIDATKNLEELLAIIAELQTQNSVKQQAYLDTLDRSWIPQIQMMSATIQTLRDMTGGAKNANIILISGDQLCVLLARIIGLNCIYDSPNVIKLYRPIDKKIDPDQQAYIEAEYQRGKKELFNKNNIEKFNYIISLDFRTNLTKLRESIGIYNIPNLKNTNHLKQLLLSIQIFDMMLFISTIIDIIEKFRIEYKHDSFAIEATMNVSTFPKTIVRRYDTIKLLFNDLNKHGIDISMLYELGQAISFNPLFDGNKNFDALHYTKLSYFHINKISEVFIKYTTARTKGYEDRGPTWMNIVDNYTIAYHSIVDNFLDEDLSYFVKMYTEKFKVIPSRKDISQIQHIYDSEFNPLLFDLLDASYKHIVAKRAQNGLHMPIQGDIIPFIWGQVKQPIKADGTFGGRAPVEISTPLFTMNHAPHKQEIQHKPQNKKPLTDKHEALLKKFLNSPVKNPFAIVQQIPQSTLNTIKRNNYVKDTCSEVIVLLNDIFVEVSNTTFHSIMKHLILEIELHNVLTECTHPLRVFSLCVLSLNKLIQRCEAYNNKELYSKLKNSMAHSTSSDTFISELEKIYDSYSKKVSNTLEVQRGKIIRDFYKNIKPSSGIYSSLFYKMYNKIAMDWDYNINYDDYPRDPITGWFLKKFHIHDTIHSDDREIISLITLGLAHDIWGGSVKNNTSILAKLFTVPAHWNDDNNWSNLLERLYRHVHKILLQYPSSRYKSSTRKRSHAIPTHQHTAKSAHSRRHTAKSASHSRTTTHKKKHHSR